jgi:hypothetical protein
MMEMRAQSNPRRRHLRRALCVSLGCGALLLIAACCLNWRRIAASVVFERMNGYVDASLIETVTSGSGFSRELSQRLWRDFLRVRDLAGYEYFVEKLMSPDYVEANIAGLALCSLFESLAFERSAIFQLVDGHREQIQGQVRSFGKHKARWIADTLTLDNRVRTLYRE